MLQAERARNKPSGMSFHELTLFWCRRVKCDESKPSCLRCVTTQRICEGYPNPPQRTLSPDSLSDEERRAFLFRSRRLLTEFLVNVMPMTGSQFCFNSATMKHRSSMLSPLWHPYMRAQSPGIPPSAFDTPIACPDHITNVGTKTLYLRH
jgi:hypothetical protein